MSEHLQATPTGPLMWLLQQLLEEIRRLTRAVKDLQQQLDLRGRA